MVVDSEAQVIYVSGGRIFDRELRMNKYIGLFAYDIRKGSWKELRSAIPQPSRKTMY